MLKKKDIKDIIKIISQLDRVYYKLEVVFITAPSLTINQGYAIHSNMEDLCSIWLQSTKGSQIKVSSFII